MLALPRVPFWFVVRTSTRFALDQNNSIHDVLVGPKNCEERAVWRANVNLAIQRIRRGYHGARMPRNLQSLLYGVAQQVDDSYRTVGPSPWLAVYARVPSDSAVTLAGFFPTGTVNVVPNVGLSFPYWSRLTSIRLMVLPS